MGRITVPAIVATLIAFGTTGAASTVTPLDPSVPAPEGIDHSVISPSVLAPAALDPAPSAAVPVGSPISTDASLVGLPSLRPAPTESIGVPRATVQPARTEAVPGGVVFTSVTSAAASAPAIANGGFEAGLHNWLSSHHQDHTTTAIGFADDDFTNGDPHLEVTVDRSEGAVAQDVAIRPLAGHRYAAAVRARSKSGFPVLVELAVHALNEFGGIGETASRLVMVEQQEVPITAALEPTADHTSLRVEIYVHTVARPVLLDDVSLLVDADHRGAANLGYQQPRVRYLDDPVAGPVDLANLTPGGSYRIEVSVDTTTDQPWRCCEPVGAIRLGTEDEDLVGGSDRSSALHTAGDVDGSAWISANRILFDRAESTVGGNFTTTITAPTEPGPFAERFRVVSEGVTWLPGPVIEVIGSVNSSVVEAPDQPDTGAANLAAECPAQLSLAGPGPLPADCAKEIEGFDPQVADIGPGAVTLVWSRPDQVPGSRYLVEVQDLSIPSGAERRTAARTIEITDPGPASRSVVRAVIEAVPGRYSAQIVALDDAERWVRSPKVPFEIIEPTPIVEVPVSPLGCRTESGTINPGFCPPDDGNPPTGPGDGSQPGKPEGDPPPGPDDRPPTVPTDGETRCRTARLIFGRNALMRYEGHDRSDVLPIRLACARYEILLRSTDPRHGAGYQTDQTEERWYLEALDADGRVLFTSEPTPDLSDDRTEDVFAVGVADLSGAVAVVARHTGQGSSANSVIVSAELRPVG